MSSAKDRAEVRRVLGLDFIEQWKDSQFEAKLAGILQGRQPGSEVSIVRNPDGVAIVMMLADGTPIGTAGPTLIEAFKAFIEIERELFPCEHDELYKALEAMVL